VAPSHISRKESVDDFSLLGRENVTPHKDTDIDEKSNKYRIYNSNHRVCASDKSAKNLVATKTQSEEKVAGESPDKKSLLFNYAWHLKKQGYAESTISSKEKLLKHMLKNGVDVFDPETVKAFIATKNTWCQGRKRNAVHAYTNFLNQIGKTWDQPNYESVSKPIWIPKESEIDQLIAGLNHRFATFCQLLKETGARPKEAFSLKWSDFQFDPNKVNITPAKNGNPRTLKISQKLEAMLKKLPRKNEYVFKTTKLKHFRTNYIRKRKRIAAKLENPRINKISFKTFRHFKGTKLYSQTKDILLVKYTLGHKSIKNTLVYTHLLDHVDEEFVTKVAKDAEEACTLIESGFEYVMTTPDDHMIFRKRK